jgi:hypothetical protein
LLASAVTSGELLVVVAVPAVPEVTDDVSELTICVSMAGASRVLLVAGTLVVPAADPTVKLLSRSASSPVPDVLTLARLPVTLPTAERNWKVCKPVGWKPL